MSNFKLDAFLPYRLSLAANTLSRALSEIYAPYGLTRTQWRVLAVLSGGDMTAADISQKTMMDKTTLSRAIKKLIGREFVKRLASQNDGRSSPLTMSAQGRKAFDEITPLVLSFEQELVKKIPAADLKTLERVLKNLLNN